VSIGVDVAKHVAICGLDMSLYLMLSMRIMTMGIDIHACTITGC